MLEELRTAQIVLCLVAMAPWIWLALKYKRYGGYAFAPIWFLLNIVIFNVFRVYGIPVDTSIANVWSIGIRVMGILAAGILGGGLLFDLRNNGYVR